MKIRLLGVQSHCCKHLKPGCESLLKEGFRCRPCKNGMIQVLCVQLSLVHLRFIPNTLRFLKFHARLERRDARRWAIHGIYDACVDYHVGAADGKNANVSAAVAREKAEEKANVSAVVAREKAEEKANVSPVVRTEKAEAAEL